MNLLVVFLLAAAAWQMPAQQPPPETPLHPTIHAPLPQNVEDYWFAPRPADLSAARNPARLHVPVLSGRFPCLSRGPVLSG